MTAPERPAPPALPRPSILVVDDDDVFRGRLARALAQRGLDVREAVDGAAALRAVDEESPELAVLDLRMPGPLDGLAVLRRLLEVDPGTRCVVLTGYGSIATAVEAIKRGAIHYLTKPADADDVLGALGVERTEGDDGAPRAETPSLARVEWEHIHRVLTDCDGNVSQAARLLGLHRRSLQRKLAKYPVRR